MTENTLAFRELVRFGAIRHDLERTGANWCVPGRFGAIRCVSARGAKNEPRNGPARLDMARIWAGPGQADWSNMLWAAAAMSDAVRCTISRMASGVLALLGTCRTYRLFTITPKSLAAAADAISAAKPPA